MKIKRNLIAKRSQLERQALWKMEAKELRVQVSSDRARGNCRRRGKTYREILEALGTRNQTRLTGLDRETGTGPDRTA